MNGWFLISRFFVFVGLLGPFPGALGARIRSGHDRGLWIARLFQFLGERPLFSKRGSLAWGAKA